MSRLGELDQSVGTDANGMGAPPDIGDLHTRRTFRTPQALPKFSMRSRSTCIVSW